VDCVSTTAESSSQTARYRLVNSMVQYEPIVQQTDDEAKIKEIEELMDMFGRAVPLVEEALRYAVYVTKRRTISNES